MINQSQIIQLEIPVNSHREIECLYRPFRNSFVVSCYVITNLGGIVNRYTGTEIGNYNLRICDVHYVFAEKTKTNHCIKIMDNYGVINNTLLDFIQESGTPHNRIPLIHIALLKGIAHDHNLWT